MFSCTRCKNRNTYACVGCVGWNRYVSDAMYNHTLAMDIDKEMTMLAKAGLNNLFGIKNAERKTDMRIKKVYFNDPVTVVLWEDGTKTIVRAGEDDIYDPEKGLAMAIAKKALGNQGNYYEVFKKWLPDEVHIDFDSPCPVDTPLAGDFDGDPVTEPINDSFIWAVDISEDGHESSIFVRRDNTIILTPLQLGRLLHMSDTEVRIRCRDGYYQEAKKVNGKWQIPCVIRKMPEWLAQ